MRLVFLFAVLLFCTNGLSQNNETATGVILDSIPVSGTRAETFAQYLPETYDPNSLSAIVFIFDPAARGAVGIKSFIAGLLF